LFAVKSNPTAHNINKIIIGVFILFVV